MLRILFLPLLCLFTAVSGGAPISVDTHVSSQFLIRGEKATLEYRIPEELGPVTLLGQPKVDQLDIAPAPRATGLSRGFNRRREFLFSFSISGYREGSFIIPAVTFKLASGEASTTPVSVTIINEAQLEFQTADSVRYAAGFHVPETAPFVNQSMPAEIKLYVPAELQVEDFGIPEFERDGVAAWRFEPRPYLSHVNLFNKPYYAVSYPSSAAPTRAGEVTLGPAKLRLITVVSEFGSFGPSASYKEVHLTIPALKLEARPLPPGAPAGFANAVGSFQLTAEAPETRVREGDPVNVDLTVTGMGNLDALEAPAPADPDGWKLYPPSSMQDPVRKQLSGSTTFRQIMRPLRIHSSIPAFRLVYFDPAEEAYHTLSTEPIPITIIPVAAENIGTGSSSPPPALPIPVEEMTDILGILKHPAAASPQRRFAGEWWQLVPAALALLLLARIFQSRVAPRLKVNPVQRARNQDLQSLAKGPRGMREFYRAAGGFIEKWLGDLDAPEAREILAKRDEICFQKHVPREDPIPRAERQKILRVLRKLVVPVLTLLLAAGTTPEATATPEGPQSLAVDAYEQGRYREAASHWLESGPWDQLSADTLYDIGNAAYRLGAPGQAALYWRRALLREETHAEARQNLRFLERKLGALTISRPNYQYTLASLPLAAWQQLVWASLWLIGLAILTFAATHYGSRLRVAALASLVTAPLLLVCGLAAMRYYPDDARFAPAPEQAVVTATSAVVRTDAARNAPSVIEAPAGSLCRVLARSGDWSYIAFASATRGWALNSDITPVIVSQRPQPPEATRVEPGQNT